MGGRGVLLLCSRHFYHYCPINNGIIEENETAVTGVSYGTNDNKIN